MEERDLKIYELILKYLGRRATEEQIFDIHIYPIVVIEKILSHMASSSDPISDRKLFLKTGCQRYCDARDIKINDCEEFDDRVEVPERPGIPKTFRPNLKDLANKALQPSLSPKGMPTVERGETDRTGFVNILKVLDKIGIK